MVLRSKNAGKNFEAPESGDDTAVIEAPARVISEEPAAAADAPAGEPTAKVETPLTEAAVKAEDRANAEATTNNAEKTEEAARAEATASAVREVAVRRSSAVTSALAKKFAPALTEFENLIPPGSVDFNTFVRVTVSLDGFEDSEGNDLGKEIRMQLMSYNSRWVVTPGVQDSEATDLVRYSVDGKFIDGTDGTQTVQDYLKVLKEVEGYEKASVKEYLAIYGFMTHAGEKQGKEVVLVEIPAEDRQIVELQVPPQSRALFQRYQIEAGVKISQGILQPSDTLVCRQDKVDGKNQKYANIKFAAK